MPWAKLDDRAWRHPRFDGVGLAAIGLHFVAVSYSNEKLLDGHLAKVHVEQLIGFRRGSQHEVDELVRAGLWVPEADGYYLHDYLDYSKSREEILAQREDNRERQERHRQQANETGPPPVTKEERHSGSNSVTNAVTNAHVPVPGTRYPENPEPEFVRPAGHTPPSGGTRTARKTSDDPKERTETQLRFEALVKVFGYDLATLNDRQRGNLNRIERELRQSGVPSRRVDELYRLTRDFLPPGSTITANTLPSYAHLLNDQAPKPRPKASANGGASPVYWDPDSPEYAEHKRREAEMEKGYGVVHK